MAENMIEIVELNEAELEDIMGGKAEIIPPCNSECAVSCDAS
jgi:hypothetical protein